jgi:hypothetical protein
MKKQALFESAERLYIDNQLTFEEIAQKLGTCEKTVRLWADEGLWRQKRERFVQQRESLHSKLYDFTHKLIDTMTDDWADGQKVDPGRLYALARLVDRISKAQQAEGSIKMEKDKSAPRERDGLSDEAILQIEQQLRIM